MAAAPGIVADLFERADVSLIAGWYAAVSVSTERTRSWLRFRRLPFLDPDDRNAPELAQLDYTTSNLIERSISGSAALSGAAGLVGALSVPPEVVATAIRTVRLAQRLCIVYGFDPQTDRGEMALSRALAAAYGLELPITAAVGMRVTDLPFLASPRRSGRTVAARLTRAAVTSSAWWVAGRITRFIPVLAAGAGAVDARRRTERTGQQMQAVLARLADVPARSQPIEEAVEVP